MSGYAPALIGSGLPGWLFLKRTEGTQRAAHARSAAVARDAAHFRDRIGQVRSVGDLMQDRRLLSVALQAFGLEADLPNRAFLTRILESDLSDPRSLANRLADTRYRSLAEAFGFAGPLGPRTVFPGFADRILSRFQSQRFEVAVGEQDPNMRLALGFERGLRDVLSRQGSQDARWFAILGTPPLRRVLEGALGLPNSIGALDVDRQLEDFKARSQAVLGTQDVAQLLEPERLEEVRRLFLVRAVPAGNAPAAGVLQLLGGQGSAAGVLGILYG